MIDTIKLMLRDDEFTITKPERFSPSARLMWQCPYSEVSSNGYLACRQYPDSDGIVIDDNYIAKYFPRLTYARNLQKGGFKTFLTIEFSIPKLLFKNNFQEVIDADIDTIAEVLHQRLSLMGVETHPELIRGSKVVSVHYSKNIVITKYGSCQFMLDAMSRAKVHAALEISHTDYRNGNLVRYHANSYEVVCYDKLKDLETALNVSDKRSAEDCNVLQKDMLDKYKGEEVLRFECRIGNMRKFDDITKKLGIKVEYNDFETLFSSKLSKQICLYFWDIIIDGIKHLIFHDTDIDQIFHFLSEKKKFSEAKVMSTIGAFYLANKYGAKFLRGYSHKKYQEVTSLAKSLDYSQSYTLKVAYQIKKDLIKFIPIRDNHEELTKNFVPRYKFDLDKLNLDRVLRSTAIDRGFRDNRVSSSSI